MDATPGTPPSPEPLAGSGTTGAERRARVWVVVGIVLLAVNLRPAATSLGTVLEETQRALSMSAPVAGVLTSLPVICFALTGPLATTAGRRWGLHRTSLATLLLVVAGLMVRAATGSVLVFTLASGLALAGMAAGNVLLPPLVKRHFPDKVGALTALYSTALMAGAALPAWVTVPVSEATGSWRYGLAMWGVLAAIGILPWLGLLVHDVRGDDRPAVRHSMRRVAHTRLGWQMALFFGIQSSFAYTMFGWLPNIYRDAGLDAAYAATMLGLLTTAGIPLALVLPSYAARQPDQRLTVIAVSACAMAGFLGLLAAPTAAPWLWALLLGIGGSAFPWCLTMIGLRARTPDGTAVLSGFVQSAGYVLAAAGPFGAGLLYDLTGGWTVPLLVLAGLCLPLAMTGLTFARPRYIEDELYPSVGPVSETSR